MGWSDLPPDLLREIAGRMHFATDLVSFSAICKPWRNSLDLMCQKQLLPWLLAPMEKPGQSSPTKLRCVFSKSSYRVLPPPDPRGTNWVCSADGATARYLTINKQLRPTLHDPITGAVTDLPCFPYHIHGHWPENPGGIIYGDGTVFLFGVSSFASGNTKFRAALLRPDEAEWTLVNLDFGVRNPDFCAAYHGGRILLTMESSRCPFVTPDGGGNVVVVARPWRRSSWSEQPRSSYILESNGELLLVSVQVRVQVQVIKDRPFVLSVHALEETTSSPQKELRWVRKRGSRLVDRVFFLGSPNSFAVDATLLGLGAHGGCAYFVHSNSDLELSGVFRYSFVDGKTKFMEPLPREWDNDKCTWLVPKPTITSIQEILGKKTEQQVVMKQQQQKTAPVTGPSPIYRIHRHYENSFRVLVRDLPLKVNESQLQQFFSKHGKVSSTEIINHKNTKTSHGVGIVRMATMHAHQDDAIAALNGLDFDGCTLEVILVNDTQRRRRRKAP